MCPCGRPIFHVRFCQVDQVGAPGEERDVQGHDDAEWGHYEHKDVVCFAEPAVTQVVTWAEVSVQAEEGRDDEDGHEPAERGVHSEALPFHTCNKGIICTALNRSTWEVIPYWEMRTFHVSEMLNFIYFNTLHIRNYWILGLGPTSGILKTLNNTTFSEI
jgi:hypothetical protein